MSDHPSLAELESALPFVDRHIGLRPEDVERMLADLGFASLDALMEAAVPGGIRTTGELDLPPAASEDAVARELRALAALNNPAEAMIGLGYHATITPPVIRRNVLEDPSWYTAYTPYQPEISQGRLEALINFQTVIGDLTGLPTANASLLDEGTAVAEAMTLVRRANRKATGAFVVDSDALPQTIEVVRTRAEAMGIEVRVADLAQGLPDGDVCGVLLQYPGASGRVLDPRELAEDVSARGGKLVVAADLLALTLLESPGELGADVVVGSSQRFGVPLFYGGPHAGYMAVAAGLERHLPGRLVGVSVDAEGRPAYRLALQTREQHIRRDKATSNICTAQVLLAVVASMYAVHHGPEGLRTIARRTHRCAAVLAAALREAGVEVVHGAFFDTVLAAVPGPRRRTSSRRRARPGSTCAWSTTTTSASPPASAPGSRTVATRAGGVRRRDRRPRGRRHPHPGRAAGRAGPQDRLPRARGVQQPPLRDPDAALPAPAQRPRLRAGPRHDPARLVHHEAQRDDRDGAGEPAGLRRPAPVRAGRGRRRATSGSSTSSRAGWPRSPATTGSASSPTPAPRASSPGCWPSAATTAANGDTARDVCLIPSSAHGTNAASAVMAGMRVVVVKAADDGGVDLDDLRAQCEAHRDSLAAIMVTYPSTHGAYEDSIGELCRIVHDHGGQVYVDGANLNALLGFAKPGEFGGDVSHLNLHKTFCIPHGGGGPGVGPVAVREHLAPYLPSHGMHPEADKRDGHRPDQRRAVRLGRDPADLVGLRPADGRRRPDPGDRGRRAERQLRRQAARRALPGALPRPRRAGRPRVHPRRARADQGHRRDRRRRGQAARRLRLPRPDHVVPGRRAR